jgi:hypothetical protein
MYKPKHIRRGKLRIPIAATSVLLLVSAAGTAGIGYSSWEITKTTPAQPVSSATLGASTSLSTLSAPSPTGPLAPGDSYSDPVVLTNTASVGSISVTDTSSSSASSLNLTVYECSTSWTAGSATDSYSCSGTKTTALTSTAVSSVTDSLLSLGSSHLPAGGTENLLFTYTLSPSAPQSLAGTSYKQTLSFTTTQGYTGAID